MKINLNKNVVNNNLLNFKVQYCSVFVYGQRKSTEGEISLFETLMLRMLPFLYFVVLLEFSCEQVEVIWGFNQGDILEYFVNENYYFGNINNTTTNLMEVELNALLVKKY